MRSSLAAARFVRPLALACAGALLLLSSPLLMTPTLPQAHADATAVTITGPNPAWDEINSQPMADLPTVSVSQTQSLVDQTVQVSWTNFSPSTNDPYNASTPAGGIYYDEQNSLYPVWILECRGIDPQIVNGDLSKSCTVDANGSTLGANGLGNSVKAVTTPTGVGQASFHIETAQSNDLLGCDQTHPCSLVVLPAFGGMQNPNNPIDCANHSLDYPTPDNGYDSSTDLAGNQAFGQSCSWSNRFVVPLHFAPTPVSCPNVAPTFSAAGSPMLGRAMAQWQSGWCHGAASLNFGYNDTSNEYQARSNFFNGSGALSGATDVALTSQPADGARKHTYAPIANTDIAIAFVVDDPVTGAVIPNLTLNARLVAKLLTQSYAPYNYSCIIADSAVQSPSCDPAVRGNPLSIFTDPEFRKLNPQVTAADFSQQFLSSGQFFPAVVSGNSDLTWALTSWIATDPDARAFLQGKLDDWGMHVNTYYRNVSYPTSQFQALDPGYVDTHDVSTATMQNSWQPVTGLDTIGRITVGNTSNSLYVDCSQLGAGIPCTTKKNVESLGARALFAVLDQGQAASYDFPVAHLVNAAGVAVAPTVASISAALATMHTNADGITQQMNFTSKNAANYPLTMVDYAMLPTCGLSAKTATGITGFLGKVAQSQTYGVQPGTIAPGYVALTDTQLTQLSTAASAVGTQPCAAAQAPPKVPSPAPSSSVAAHSTTQPDGGGNAGTGSGSGANGSGAAGDGGAASAAPPVPAGTAPVLQKPLASAAPALAPLAFGYKPPASADSMQYVLPALLIVGAVLLLGGPGAYLVVSTGAATGLTSWARGRLGRRR